MNKQGTLLFLGTGSSMGIPVIGCSCSVCQSHLPFNKRLRPSVLIEVDQKRILIDCGSDFREQALKFHLDYIDGVIFTHAHHDHTAGIDDLKTYSLRERKKTQILFSKETQQDLLKRFYYLFTENSNFGMSKYFEMNLIQNNRGSTVFQGLVVNYFSYEQISMQVNGYRFGNLAYVSDIRKYPETIFEDLKGIDILVLSALRFPSSAMHFSIDEAIEFAKRVGAKKTWLMHISHEVDHEKAGAYLPENIKIAYDGLKVNFNAEIMGDN